MRGEHIVMVTTIVVMVATLSSAGYLPYDVGAHARRDVTLEPCQLAAQSLHQLLEMNDQWMDTFLHFAGFNYSDFSGEDLMCSLKDVTTVREALDILNSSPRQYLFRVFKAIYGDVFDNIAYMKVLYVQNPGLPNSKLCLELIRHLQATGVTELYTEDREWLVDLVSSDSQSLMNPEPLSTLPMSSQCDVLTNDVRKIWNSLVNDSPLPDAGAYFRAIVYRVTGIQIPSGSETHREIKELICSFVSPDTLEDLYQVVRQNGIHYSIVHYLYRENVDYLNVMLSDGFDYYDNQPSRDEPNMESVILELLQNVKDMGLLDLE